MPEVGDHVTLAGPDEAIVGRFVSEAVNALSPWTVEQLFREFDRSEDVVERGRLTPRIGLAAGACSRAAPERPTTAPPP